MFFSTSAFSTKCFMLSLATPGIQAKGKPAGAKKSIRM